MHWGEEGKIHEVGVDPESFRHLQECMRKDNVEKAIGVGLWFDAVPFNFDRNESVWEINMLLPRVTGQFLF